MYRGLLFLSLFALPASAFPTQLRTGVVAGRLEATVVIEDGVESTELRQTLRNENATVAEAVWIVPLPDGAVADRFEMTTDGVTLKGDVLGAEEARATYEAIVRRRRDPGLLEYMGRGLLRVNVFPIPAHAETEVVVGYRSVLPGFADVYRWSLALDAAGLDGVPAAEVVLDVTVRSSQGLANVFSPHPDLDVLRKGPGEARLSFEGRRSELATGEVSASFGLSEHEFGLNLLTHRARKDAPGTFALLLSPQRTAAEREALRKSILFVLDTSGSMRGAKIEQAKDAVRTFVKSLNAEDRFNVVPFATEARPFFEEPVPATWFRKAEALSMVEGIGARGGTNVEDAVRVGLSHAFDDEGRVPLTVFLTDGLPSVGERDTGVLVERVAQKARGARVFVLGVGADVNTALLDGFAERTGGRRYYVEESEGIEVETHALFAMLSHPVLSDLELELEGVREIGRVPRRLSNLYLGETLQVFGQYEGHGEGVVRLKGRSGAEERTFEYRVAFPQAHAENAALPVLWAERRVGALLDELRLHGDTPELVDEIERLGAEFGIVTPYTSHLILEEGMGAGPGGPPAPRVGGPTAPGPRRQYRGPGDTGPGAPGAAPVTSGGGGGSAGFFLGRGQRDPSTRPADMKRMTRDWLVANGVLPKDATPKELDELGRRVTGRGAVADSRYLDGLVRDGRRASGMEWVRLFTRRAGDKVFRLREGVWTDRAFDPVTMTERRRIAAYSREHFDLLKEKPALARYLGLSDRLIVVFEGVVYEFH